MDNSTYSMIILLIVSIACIVVFFNKFKFIKIYGLLTWGIFILSDFIFTVTAPIILIFTAIPQQSFFKLVSNIIMAFQFASVLAVYNHFKIVKSKTLIALFITFFSIWLIEFYVKGIHNPNFLFNANICSAIIVVGLVWFYLLNLYKNNTEKYTNIPLFWINLGWIISSITSYLLENPDLESSGKSMGLLIQFAAYGGCFARLFYSIGFWKTKQWVQQTQ